MKAWVQHKYGASKDLLNLTEVPLPTLRPLDILVKLQGVATNPVDTKKLSGPKSSQGEDINGEKGLIAGWDGCGVITEIGEEVKLFQIGDEVYFAGDLTRDGCFSEYVAVDSRVVAHKPRSVDFVTASAVPLTALTAFEGLTESLRINDGRGLSLLVVAGAGGVGSIATQLAKRILKFDTVIATASRQETIDFCLENGADYTINHRENMKEQLDNLGFTSGVDVIFNCAEVDNNWSELPACLKHLGRILLITEMANNINLSEGLMVKRASVSYELMFSRLILNDEPEKQGEILSNYARWIDSGVISARVKDENRYNILDLPTALDLQQGGSTIGKLVLDCSTWEQ